MRRHRTTALCPPFLGALASFVLATVAAVAVTAQASGAAQSGVPRLVFPLVAKTELWDNYGDPRPNGHHAGIDMENPWRAPVVAVEDGRIKYWESGLGGCMLYHYGVSGTTYLYIHLNNDLTPRNDNKGGCVKDIAFAVPNGARVTAGQQIAWNGDSGDASGNPHLHFEVHPNDGVDVNPFRYLRRASKPLFAARKGSIFSLGLRGRLLAAGAGAATLEVDRVRQYPGGRWLEIDFREVELTVPLGADIAPSLQLTGSTMRAFKSPVTVAAYTLKANATTEAILGAPGELLLGRVAPAP
jgi:peptidase M23-like protein